MVFYSGNERSKMDKNLKKTNSMYSVIYEFPSFPESILIVMLLFVASCAPVISQQVREQARPDITFKEVHNTPEHYKGQVVILSGFIVEAKNTKEGTLLEILQAPAGFRGKPRDADESEGRFLALSNHYLDTSIYTKERKVTVAGEVQGKRVQPLGKTEYVYPLLHVKEIHLWPVEEVHPYPYPHPYPYSYYGFDRYYWLRDHRHHRIPKHRKDGKDHKQRKR